MSFKRAAAVAAALAILAPAITPAFATGTRLDRDDREQRRKAKQAAAAEAEARVWHYASGAQKVGPLTQSEMIDAAKAGTITAATQVYHPDAGWRAAGEVPELMYVTR
ncbi:MAG: DUF4339 domain-containing protein [Micropepsaceae bacterium]